MNCEEFMSLLDRFADLNENELSQLEEHASICDNCRSELEFMKSIIGTAQSLPPIEPPADFLQTVNNRLDKELAAEPKIVYFMRQAKPYIHRYGTIAACLAIGIAIGANGNMLVSRMNDTDGVISETATVTEDSTTHGTDAVTQTQIAPEAISQTTPAPVITEPDVVSSSYNTATTLRPSVDVNTTVPVAATAKPVTQVEAIAVPTATTVPQTTVVPVNEPEAAPAAQMVEESNEGIMVAALDIEEPQMPVGYSIRMIDEPEVTPEIYAEADVAAEYSIATTQPTAETAYVAPLSSTIMVKEADAERAKEIIMEYVEATYGNYYMITGDKLYSLSLRLDSEGIWYYANLTDTGAKVSFKLVTM